MPKPLDNNVLEDRSLYRHGDKGKSLEHIGAKGVDVIRHPTFRPDDFLSGRAVGWLSTANFRFKYES